ncbi:MAG: cytochrome c3 family protein [Raoultibacter sp.]
MSEDNKVEAMQDEVAAEASTESLAEGAPKKKRKKLPIILGVIVAVVIVAGAGFFVWHEEPSFCNAICHSPMDPYNETFDQAIDTAGVDKWGNEVTTTTAMMSVVHKEEDVDCLACHVPTIGEQLSEGMHWVSGDFTDPLEESTMADLTEARGIDDDEFCLNDSCHHVTDDGKAITSREDLKAIYDDIERNPHKDQHGEIACGECHKAHRASVNYCSQCHSDALLPDGWLTVAKAKKLDNNYSATY